MLSEVPGLPAASRRKAQVEWPAATRRAEPGAARFHPQPPAMRAAMNQHPPVFPADGDRDRLHAAWAAGLPVTRGVAIKVPGPQATGAMVAMRGAGSIQRYVYAAMSALKRARKRQA